MNQGGDQELENLVTKLAILKDLLSSIEKKVHGQILTFACTLSPFCSLSETFFIISQSLQLSHTGTQM